MYVILLYDFFLPGHNNAQYFVQIFFNSLNQPKRQLISHCANETHKIRILNDVLLVLHHHIHLSCTYLVLTFHPFTWQFSEWEAYGRASCFLAIMAGRTGRWVVQRLSMAMVDCTVPCLLIDEALQSCVELGKRQRRERERDWRRIRDISPTSDINRQSQISHIKTQRKISGLGNKSSCQEH